MKPQGVIETGLYAPDLPAARAFYEDVLGLELVSSMEGRHMFFRCGQGMLLLFNPNQTRIKTGSVPTHGATGPGHMAFRMDASEIDGWREQLTAGECAIETEIDWPGGGHSIYFRDPAGNSLELTTAATWGL